VTERKRGNYGRGIRKTWEPGDPEDRRAIDFIVYNAAIPAGDPTESTLSASLKKSGFSEKIEGSNSLNFAKSSEIFSRENSPAGIAVYNVRVYL